MIDVKCVASNSKPIVYQSLWVTGAVLVLVSVPCYRSNAAFYSLMSIGIAMVIVGLLLWSYQAGQPVPVKKVKTVVIPEPLPVGTSELAQVPLPVTEAQLLENNHGNEYIISRMSAVPEPPVVVPVPTQKLKSSISSKKKHRKKKSSVRLSEKSDVKEFDKAEAPLAVSGNQVTYVPTKGTLYSPGAPYKYPTVEDIRLERERFANRPETPEIDKQRRLGMLREFALSMGTPRDGSLIPLVQQQAV